jgi:hypothetical protein
MAAVTRALAALIALAVILHLAQSIVAAAMFLAFVAAFLFPAIVLASRAPHIRDLPPDLRMIAASVVVILFSAPWYFARKAIGMPLAADAVLCVVLIALAVRLIPHFEFRPTPLLAAVPVVFALAWLGYAARIGNRVHYFGLFAIDFGNLVSVVSSLRASSMLPLAYVVDGGPLNYHWLYFTLPATLADFLGLAMPNANALILTNLLMALLLVHTVVTIARSVWPAAIVLFAPFTVYAYQLVAARLELGWLEVPARNHLLLSPLNSMIVFGNNTFALVLALFTLAMLERWNAGGKIGDAILGVLALAAIIGYSITLVFPLAGALLVWTLIGRVRKPWLALPLAALAGIGAIATFRAIGILGSDSSRRIAFAFDGGAFLRMVVLGMLPLWLLLILRGRQRLTLHHVLIAVALAVPSVLLIEGSITGNVDFSMKTASLIAVAFAPLIAIPEGRRRTLALAIVAVGVLHSAAYVLQYPWYRMQGRGRGESIAAGYHDAMVWIRDHTARNVVVIDPASVPVSTVVWPMIVAERRVWLPTQYTESALIASSSALTMRQRLSEWQANRMPRTDVAVLAYPCETARAWWRTEQRFGMWSVCVRKR